jgi:hypothetical protein
MGLPPTKFDVVKGAFLLAVAVVATILLVVLMSTGSCVYQAIKTGEMGKCADLRIGEYLASTLMAVLAIIHAVINRPNKDGDQS